MAVLQRQLGQVFTPDEVVAAMLALRRRVGRILEPSAGNGAFLTKLPSNAVGIEYDAVHCPAGALNQDFFDYPTTEQFASIMGNPPYVRFQEIQESTRALLEKQGRLARYDGRTNLYVFFIDKCLEHLLPGGELIFITPRDFLKSTSARALNRRLFQMGRLTHVIDLGDAHIFENALPNCLIWRFERGQTTDQMRYARLGNPDWRRQITQPVWADYAQFEQDGFLYFTKTVYPLRLSQIASVRVGAVSGADAIFEQPSAQNREFVYSQTAATGQTRSMIWCDPWESTVPPRELYPHKSALINRHVRHFGEHNWWHWGRKHFQSEAPRIYVNHKTRKPRPFFLHPCLDYDGSVLAIFPHDPHVDIQALTQALNALDWAELGFVCDNRYLFSQRALSQAPLPAVFAQFLPAVPTKNASGI